MESSVGRGLQQSMPGINSALLKLPGQYRFYRILICTLQCLPSLSNTHLYSLWFYYYFFALHLFTAIFLVRVQKYSHWLEAGIDTCLCAHGVKVAVTMSLSCTFWCRGPTSTLPRAFARPQLGGCKEVSWRPEAALLVSLELDGRAFSPANVPHDDGVIGTA